MGGGALMGGDVLIGGGCIDGTGHVDGGPIDGRGGGGAGGLVAVKLSRCTLR